MTDIISTDAFAVRRARLPRRNQLKITIGNAMIAATAAVAQAFAMAYVTPYRSRPPAGLDVDPQGRDPNW